MRIGFEDSAKAPSGSLRFGDLSPFTGHDLHLKLEFTKVVLFTGFFFFCFVFNFNNQRVLHFFICNTAHPKIQYS